MHDSVGVQGIKRKRKEEGEKRRENTSMSKAINSMLTEAFSFLFPPFYFLSLISGYYRECHG